MHTYNADITKLQRHYLNPNFNVDNWENIVPIFEELNARTLNCKTALMQWLTDMSEVEAAISEDACWRQIKMTCDTENIALRTAFEFFCMEIQPKLQPWSDKLNKKLIACPFVNELPEAAFFTYLRSVKKSIALYQDANVPLQAELSILQQKFGEITGAMMVTINSKEYTLQQAAKFLENPDRKLRQTAYEAINNRRQQSVAPLNDLFNKLILIRHQMALNAGFKNYTNYRFEELGRFDYAVADCEAFSEGVALHVMPLVNEIYAHKKNKLGVQNFSPYDVDAEPVGVEPLQPFTNSDDLLQKSIACFEDVNPFFAACLRKMKALGNFDLESRKGKAPGGYNCPLTETGAPFIFMNAAGQMSDVTTMVHEGGHAVHSFLAHPLKLSSFKEYPMEIAEVASMAMELFSMDYWHHFFTNEADLKRAKIHQLERVITIFPWIATIDSFQHWLYANPAHSNEQRAEAWELILQKFSNNVIDYTGYENYRSYQWQKQLHLYEVPFYYIEYGIAQLGAIGMWQQYKQNKDAALQNYCNALALGGTKTLPELYKTAGLNFDFSPTQIGKLMQFVKAELDILLNN